MHPPAVFLRLEPGFCVMMHTLLRYKNPGTVAGILVI